MTLPKLRTQDIASKHELQTNEDFLDITLANKATEFASKFYASENSDFSLEDDIQGIRAVFEWAGQHMGKQRLLEYFEESPFTRAEIMQKFAECKTPDQKLYWQQTYSAWLEQIPTPKTRLDQLMNLLDAQLKVQQTYPEVNLIMLPIEYKNIEQIYMPAFGENDTIQERLDKPGNLIAKQYSGQVVVDSELLRAIRGKDTPNPKGIDIHKTHFGDLHTQANKIGNYGLMLVDENLHTREKLKEIRSFTGVNTMSAGLAEGIALAQTGSLRIDDCLGFPKYIPNSKGDYYCGVNVEREFIENPYSNMPRIYFGLWREEGSQNCVLAVTV